MKFGYTIIYVGDVAASLEFFGRAFGLETRFLHESGINFDVSDCAPCCWED